MEKELNGLLSASVTVAAALVCTHLLHRQIPPVRWRLAGILPVLLLFTQLPLRFSTIHLRLAVAYHLWLAGSKLLLLAFHRGPLARPDLPLSSFLTIAAFPVAVRDGQRWPPASPTVAALFGIPAKAALLALIIASFYPERHRRPRALVVGLYAVHTYLLLDLALSSCAAAARVLLQRAVALEPQFRAPYLSSSLQDFWGGRWNVAVSRILHSLVYAPVRARLGVPAGVVTTFLVSGLAHEAMFYAATLGRQTGETTCFFLVQGLCVAAEIKAKARLAGEGWRPLPRAVAAPLTLAFVAVTAAALLYPPLMRGGTEEKAVGESLAALRALGKVHQWLKWSADGR